jgi:hypothetical protein
MTMQDYDVAQILQADRRADAARHRLATAAFRNSTEPSVSSFTSYGGAAGRLCGWMLGQLALVRRAASAERGSGA